MDELIGQLTSKLGISDSIANMATGKVMALVKDQVGDDLFGQIASAIPGASDAADAGAAESSDGGGGGMLGAIAGMASSMLGGSAGDALNIGSALSSAGLQSDQVGGFVTTVIEFIKSKVGDEVTDQLLEKVPMLKSLLG